MMPIGKGAMTRHTLLVAVVLAISNTGDLVQVFGQFLRCAIHYMTGIAYPNVNAEQGMLLHLSALQSL